MTKTVRIPKDLHAELAARKRPDETMAEVIARHIHRPHPAETRAMLTGEDTEAVEAAIEELHDEEESDRLGRARRSFEAGDESGDAS